jgi:hypothetical protein
MKYLFLIIVGCFVAACVASSSYMNFGLDVSRVNNPENGILLAPKGREKEDTDLRECLPRKGLKFPCRVVKHEVYLKILADLRKAEQDTKELKTRLIACERNS